MILFLDTLWLTDNETPQKINLEKVKYWNVTVSHPNKRVNPKPATVSLNGLILGQVPGQLLVLVHCVL